MKARVHTAPESEGTGRPPFWRRVKRIFGTLLLLLLATVIVIGGSIWMEHRHPSDEEGRALFPRFQKWITRPIVDASGRWLSRYFRDLAEDTIIEEDWSLGETIAYFGNPAMPLADRRRHAFRLARDGTPEALAALRHALDHAPPEHRAHLAWLIGSTRNPATKELLWPLLNDPDERVVRGAIRGLAFLGGKDVEQRMEQHLTGTGVAESLRVEAAAALGSIGTWEACGILTTRLERPASEALATQILDSLGSFPFSGVESTFERFLATPERPAASRVAAAESLAHSSPEAVPFLLKLSEHDADADVRASAAWAISAQGPVRGLAPQLVTIASREAEPDVRRRLYEAMLPQEGLPPEELRDLVAAEIDLAAKVAGFNALGCTIGRDPSSPITSAFDRESVPELRAIATGSNSTNLQMRAVFALRRAGTPAAQAALADIARGAAPVIAQAAGNGLKAPP
jgi:HEAT repeat protein